MDVARGEIVEAELDAMIRRRSRQKDPEEEHDLWKAQERLYRGRREAENRAAWYGWHLDQAERHRRTLEALVSHHEVEAEKLMEATDERSTT